MKIHSQDDALKAMQLVHEKGPNVVVMSSSTFENNDILTTIGSRWKGSLVAELSTNYFSLMSSSLFYILFSILAIFKSGQPIVVKKLHE